MKITSLRAGALYLVLVIGLVISSVIASVLLMGYQRSHILSMHSKVTRLERNAASGIVYLMAQRGEKAISFELDLYGTGEDSVNLSLRPWGIFNVAVAQAHASSYKVQKAAMLGSDLDSLREVALYLADEDRPLRIAENVAIIGKCFLPRLGFKRVADLSRASENLESMQKASQSTIALPENFNAILNRAKYYFNSETNFVARPATLTEGSTGGSTIKNSFNEEAIIIKSSKALWLNEIKIEGQVIVLSGTSVHISSTALLNDVIVVAPYIEVEAGFRGALQLFAQDSITVAPNCQLNYPSAICVANTTQGGYVYINKGSKITGQVFIGGGISGGQYHQLLLEGEVEGQVFVDGRIEHKGQINGGIFCRRLILRTTSVLEDNYLKDAIINVKGMSKFYLADVVSSSNSRKGIVKWLE